MYIRFIEKNIQTALQDTPIIVLNGPRQSGKTTLAKKLTTERWKYFTLDDVNVLTAAQTDPEGFVRELEYAVIDEIQRAPNLILAIKKSVDLDRRPGRFLLTGSAHLLMLPMVKESLAGRMEIIPVYPLACSEIADKDPVTFFDTLFQGIPPEADGSIVGDELLAIILRGGYPEVLLRDSEKRRQAWYKSYLSALIERDVKDVANVDKLTKIPRLFETIACHASQLINLTALGGQLGLERKTSEKYLGIFETLFLVNRIPPWYCNQLNRLIKTPKLHFLDAGLLAAVRGFDWSYLKANRHEVGVLFETFVYSELLKQATWCEQTLTFSHYRDRDQYEVDFVIENTRREVVGIEVKAAATVTTSDFNGMKKLANAAAEKFKIGIVLYDGSHVLPFGEKLYAVPLSMLWNFKRK